eukprot:984523-Prymnesium_polylepis.1
MANANHGTSGLAKAASHLLPQATEGKDAVLLPETKHHLLLPLTSTSEVELIRRHDRYLATFGSIPPEILMLEFGPSQRSPSTECLSAVYRSPEGEVMRMDIGTDDTTRCWCTRPPTQSSPGTSSK